jgi:peptidyl-prolyl cis-trans isomerase D
MAVLQQIREKTILVLFIIGIGMFAFLFTGSEQSSLFPSSSENNVGSIYGEEVSRNEFSNVLDQVSQQYPDATQNQQNNLAWNSIINERIIASVSENIGLDVTGKEIYELETGTINDNNISAIFQGAGKEMVDNMRNNFDNLPDAKKDEFLFFEDQAIKDRYTQKYQYLVEKGMYTTNSEMVNTLNSRIQNATVQYVSVPFSTETVEVSEEEIIQYYNNNISDFKNDSETRDIEYVTFTVVPSSEDDINVRNELTELSVRFKDSDKDESFSKSHSTDNLTSFPYLSPANITDPKFSELISQEVGTVDGPYKLTNGRYRLSKLSEIVERPDSIKASHILIRYAENFSQDSAYTILKEYRRLVRDGSDFGELALQFSEDRPSALKGGVVEGPGHENGWLVEGETQPTFNDTCFSSKEGDMKLATTQYGFHLIQITAVSKLSSKYKIVYLDKEVVASSETKETHWAKATNFLNSVNKKSVDTTFKSFAEINNQLVREDINIDNMKFNVSALENSREIIKWMYNENTNVGDVSNSIYTCGNNYVVVCLSKIHEQGSKSLEEVRDFVSLLVTKEKQYKLISSKMQDATLESVATSFGVDVKTVSAVNFANPNVEGLGNEFAFVGVVNSTDIASTSSVFKGSNSAFIISVVSKTENTITEANDNQKKEINTSNVDGVFYNAVMTLLKENANVVDSRIRFY